MGLISSLFFFSHMKAEFARQDVFWVILLRNQGPILMGGTLPLILSHLPNVEFDLMEARREATLLLFGKTRDPKCSC